MTWFSDGAVGVVVVAGGFGGVTVALVEVGGCDVGIVERAVDRVAVHRVAEHRRVAVDGVTDLGAADRPVHVVPLERVEVGAAIVERGDRVGAEDRVHRSGRGDHDTVERDAEVAL